MKKNLSYFTLFIALIIADSDSVIGQTANHPWSVGVHAGWTRSNNDFGNNYFNDRHQQKLGRITVQRYLSPVFNANLSFNRGDVRTYNSRNETPDLFVTTIRSGDISLDIKPAPENWIIQPYVSAGIGLLYSDNYLNRSQYGLTVPLSGGLRFQTFENIHFDLNLKHDATFADHLDGWSTGSTKDNFLTYTAGITYNFGVRKAPAPFISETIHIDTVYINNNNDIEIARLKKELAAANSRVVPATNVVASPAVIKEESKEGGVVFKVQIGAYKKRNHTNYFDKDPNFSGEVDEDGVMKYTLGHFNNYQEATDFRKILVEMGVKGAWVVPYQGNRRLSIKDAIERK